MSDTKGILDLDIDPVLSRTHDALGHTLTSSLSVLRCCCCHVFPAEFHLPHVLCNCASPCLMWSLCCLKNPLACHLQAYFASLLSLTDVTRPNQRSLLLLTLLYNSCCHILTLTSSSVIFSVQDTPSVFRYHLLCGVSSFLSSHDNMRPEKYPAPKEALERPSVIHAKPVNNNNNNTKPAEQKPEECVLCVFNRVRRTEAQNFVEQQQRDDIYRRQLQREIISEFC